MYTRMIFPNINTPNTTLENRYEAFDLFRACDYESSDARVASLFPDLLIESDGESGAKF